MAVSFDYAAKNPRQTNQDRAYRFSKAREKRNQKSLKIGDFLIRNDFLSDDHSIFYKNV